MGGIYVFTPWDEGGAGVSEQTVTVGYGGDDVNGDK